MKCDVYNKTQLRENLILKNNPIPRAARIPVARCSEQLNFVACHPIFVCPQFGTCLCHPSATRILRSRLDFFKILEPLLISTYINYKAYRLFTWLLLISSLLTQFSKTSSDTSSIKYESTIKMSMAPHSPSY